MHHTAIQETCQDILIIKISRASRTFFFRATCYNGGAKKVEHKVGDKKMKYMRQFLLILCISFLGEGLKEVLPLPIPASIYGLNLLFTAL